MAGFVIDIRYHGAMHPGWGSGITMAAPLASYTGKPVLPMLPRQDKGVVLTDRIVLRNRWLAAFGIVFATLVPPFIMALILGGMDKGGVLGIQGWVGAPLFSAVVCWWVLKMTLFTYVEIRGEEVIVKNIFRKKIIPIQLVKEAESGPHMEVVLFSGKRYSCVGLAPSLAGAFFGFPSNRRCAETLNRCLQDKRVNHQNENLGTGARTLPYFNLTALAVLCTIFLAFSALLWFFW